MPEMELLLSKLDVRKTSSQQQWTLNILGPLVSYNETANISACSNQAATICRTELALFEANIPN